MSPVIQVHLSRNVLELTTVRDCGNLCVCALCETGTRQGNAAKNSVSKIKAE